MFVSPSYHLTLSHRHYHESSDCFEYPQKIPTYIKPPQNILAKFSYPKKSFDHPCHLKSSVLPLDLHISLILLQVETMLMVPLWCHLFTSHSSSCRDKTITYPIKCSTRDACDICTAMLAKYQTVVHYYSFTLYNIMQQQKVIKQFVIL